MGQAQRAQHLGVHSVCTGKSRSRMRMRTTMTILVVLVSPSPNRDCPRFKFLVARTSNQSCSVEKEVHAFDRALLAGVHRLTQAQRRALRHRGTSCGTVASCAFVSSAATRHVNINGAQSGRCHGASLHSSPSFSSSRYVASVSIVSVSPPHPSWNDNFTLQPAAETAPTMDTEA